MDSLHPRVREFVGARQFADYVCLGQGPFYGLACETALKVTEMSVSYAQSFHTLEFRHGPKSIVGPETLIMFLLSEQGYDAECEVLQEIKGLGGTTLTVANRADKSRPRLPPIFWSSWISTAGTGAPGAVRFCRPVDRSLHRD